MTMTMSTKHRSCTALSWAGFEGKPESGVDQVVRSVNSSHEQEQAGKPIESWT